LHRTNGPAFIQTFLIIGPPLGIADGPGKWFINDIEITDAVDRPDQGHVRTEVLVMSNNPEIDEDGTQTWRQPDGLPHRLYGPAIIYPDGSQSWVFESAPHRLDGCLAVPTARQLYLATRPRQS